MKILVTLDFPPEVGGIQRYLFGIVKHTFKETDLVLTGSDGEKSGAIETVSARVKRVSFPLSRWNKKWSNIPLFWNFVAAILRAKGPVEVLCGNVYAGCVPWTASLFFRGLDYGVYTYGTELLFCNKKSLRGWVLKKVLHKAGRLYVLGKYTAGLLRDAGIRKEPIIEPPRIELSAGIGRGDGIVDTKTTGASGGPLRILCVGRLVRHKGHAVLLQALRLLPLELNWQCVIVGSGPLLDMLRSIAVHYKIDNRVAIKTDMADEALRNEYANASLFVLPSLCDNGAEGFGIVLLEAMACGVPIIASDTGGITEVLDNGGCGALVEPGNAAVLAEAMARLHGDQPLRRRLSVLGRERVRICYAW
jgi:glycosyltransferase involved in cell wall biosynthesis